jgi:hypothetical protein
MSEQLGGQVADACGLAARPGTFTATKRSGDGYVGEPLDCGTTQRAPGVTRQPLAEAVFTASVSKTLQLSFCKPVTPHVCETRLRASANRGIPHLLLENRRLPLSRDCVHLASACRNPSPCGEAPRLENESASHSLTNEAGSSPFGARSVGESTSRVLPCQAGSRAAKEKFASTLCHVP